MKENEKKKRKKESNTFVLNSDDTGVIYSKVAAGKERELLDCDEWNFTYLLRPGPGCSKECLRYLQDKSLSGGG